MSLKLQTQLIKKLERELARCEADRERLFATVLAGRAQPNPSVPQQLSPTNPDHKRLGYFEALARETLDATHAALAELAPIDANAAEALAQRAGTLALNALLHELSLFGETNQDHLPADHRRTAASYQPLMRRIGDLPLLPADRQLWLESTERLDTLAQQTDPSLAQQAAALKAHRAKVRRERTVYEILILLFFIGVVATILIMKKNATPAPIGVPGQG